MSPGPAQPGPARLGSARQIPVLACQRPWRTQVPVPARRQPLPFATKVAVVTATVVANGNSCGSRAHGPRARGPWAHGPRARAGRAHGPRARVGSTPNPRDGCVTACSPQIWGARFPSMPTVPLHAGRRRMPPVRRPAMSGVPCPLVPSSAASRCRSPPGLCSSPAARRPPLRPQTRARRHPSSTTAAPRCPCPMSRPSGS